VKNKKVLAGPARGAAPGVPVTKGGWAIYGKEVHHPGTIPHPFMRPAFKIAVKNLENRIKKALS